MDKQKKLKFNIVDVIFLLVVLAGVVFLALRLIGSGSGSDAPSPSPENSKGTKERYIITFYASESADYVVDHLEVGSPLTDDSMTLDLGTLVDFKIGPARATSSAADGHIVISDKEGYSSVYAMSRVTGIEKGFGVVNVAGLNLEIGHSMVLRAENAKLWVVVYDIQKLEDTPYVNSKVPDADYFRDTEEDK